MEQHTLVPERLEAGKSILVVVDIQERFRQLIHDMDQVLARTRRLIEFCQELQIPIVVTEHYSRKLGTTMAELGKSFTNFEPIEKIHFSCWGCEDFKTRLDDPDRPQIILCGIEAHVCIYQTAADLMRQGKQVVAAVDAISSCSAGNREIGLQRLAGIGVQNMGVQMLMFEILQRAGTPEFKAVAGLLKE
ncbi:MAG: hydrolase [Gemmatimonadales bacterium]|nr:hydrolase [Gemmatimonadales bacterium]